MSTYMMFARSKPWRFAFVLGFTALVMLAAGLDPALAGPGEGVIYGSVQVL